MRILVLVSVIIGSFCLGSTTLKAQESGSGKAELSTTSFIVSGNCESCKNRIEKAAKSAGAKTANWTAETQILKVSFDPAATNSAKIQEKVAAAGHDTEAVKSTDKKYKSLPACCQYERVAAVKPEQGK